MKVLKGFYEEENEKQKASWAEVFLFLATLILFVIYGVFILFTGTSLSAKLSILLVPTLLWVFMRASRKDMNATANLVAALFGALGGAIVIIVTKLMG